MAFRLPPANQNDTAEYAQPLARIFAAPIRLLEFNRPAHSPWLTVPLAEEEIVIQDANDEHCFTDEYGCEVIRG